MFDVFISEYLGRVYCIHSFCVSLRCVIVIYLSYTHSDVIAGLLINGSMYICFSVAFCLILFPIKVTILLGDSNS